MKIDSRLRISASSTNKENDFILNVIREFFLQKGMAVILENRNVLLINGEAKEQGNRIEFYKVVKGRKNG